MNIPFSIPARAAAPPSPPRREAALPRDAGKWRRMSGDRRDGIRPPEKVSRPGDDRVIRDSRFRVAGAAPAGTYHILTKNR